jgi:hypothetical protein
MKKLVYTLLIPFVLVMACGIFVLFWYCVPTCESDVLLHLYNIGGIVSGVFAFGAFAVASFTYLNQKWTGDMQRFETTFFNMLALQQQITSELKCNGLEQIRLPDIGENVEKQPISKQGRELFGFLWQEKAFYDKFTSDGKIDLVNGRWYMGMGDVLISKGIEGYNEFPEVTLFDHYFRHLYQLIKFIDQVDCLNDKAKYRYTSIVRATLSSYELVWLYYNGLYGAGQPKFKPLIERYALLKNLREEFLAISKEIIEKDYFRKYSVVLTDYEAHLTDKPGVKDKYYLGAFYNTRNSKEFSIGKKWYNDSIASKLTK